MAKAWGVALVDCKKDYASTNHEVEGSYKTFIQPPFMVVCSPCLLASLLLQYLIWLESWYVEYLQNFQWEMGMCQFFSKCLQLWSCLSEITHAFNHINLFDLFCFLFMIQEKPNFWNDSGFLKSPVVCYQQDPTLSASAVHCRVLTGTLNLAGLLPPQILADSWSNQKAKVPNFPPKVAMILWLPWRLKNVQPIWGENHVVSNTIIPAPYS